VLHATAFSDFFLSIVLSRQFLRKLNNERASIQFSEDTTGNDVRIYWGARLMGPLSACANEKVASVEVLFILDGIFICCCLQLRRKSCRKCQFRERRFKFLASENGSGNRLN